MRLLIWLGLLMLIAFGCKPASDATKPSPMTSIPEVAAPKPIPKPQLDYKKKPKAKDIIVLTPRAAERVRAVWQQEVSSKKLDVNKPLYLRVGIDENFLYQLSFPDFTDHLDFMGESQGVTIVVDQQSAQNLPVGTTIDFLNENGRTGFKFSGPTADDSPADKSVSLAEARRNFTTTLTRKVSDKNPAQVPPPEIFELVRYASPVGELVAYVSPNPKDGKKKPAMIWIGGGNHNSIDEACWQEGPPSLDFSGSVYRKLGIVMMFPSLRGGNENPGIKEGFFGEVDDVIAAAKFLAKQDYVDPTRIYLCGHSTGGTLALLVAECSDLFRAVFSIGPAFDVLGYGPSANPFDFSNNEELRLRAPGRWLHSIHVPVFIIEGTGGNFDSLERLRRAAEGKSNIHCFEVAGADHFNVLGPTNQLIAKKLLQDTGVSCNLSFTDEELNLPFVKDE